ncbi:hypothetical protein [Liquorilactobacillus uvarum]|uniref:hypothetical protein n=1 Tax=Liquorilactobacillus uvarum TaxID=303240 RepID=UPI00288A13C8|nr:hypothetical protein [Liquorilactobacillus uvarum]
MNKNINQLSRRSRQTAKIPGHAISRWLVVLIGITLFFAVSAHILQKTVLNAQFVTAQATKSDYVNEATTTVNNVVADLASSNGVPTSLSSGLVTSKQVKEDLTEIVENVYAGKANAIDNQKIKNQISQNIAVKAQSAGVSTNNEEFTAVRTALLGSIDSYIDQTIQGRYLDKATAIIKKADNLTKMVFWISTIATFIFAIMLLLHDRSLLRWFHYLGLSAIWSGILMTVLAFLANNSGFFAQIAERAAQASGLVENLLELIAANFQNAGLLLILCGIFGIVVGFFRKGLKF